MTEDSVVLERRISAYMDYVLGTNTGDKEVMKKAYNNYWNVNWQIYKQKYKRKDTRYISGKLVDSWRNLTYKEKKQWYDYKNDSNT